MTEDLSITGMDIAEWMPVQTEQIRKSSMSIAIVSALSTSVPSQAASAAESAGANAESAGSALDFSSFLIEWLAAARQDADSSREDAPLTLLERLTAVRQDAGLLQEDAPLALLDHMAAARQGMGLLQGAAADSGKAGTDDDTAEFGDMPELFVAPMSPPLEQRGPLAPDDEATPTPELSGRKPPVDEKSLSDGSAQTLVRTLSDTRLPVAASGPAANFAELAGESASAMPPVAANLAASLSAGPGEAARPIPIPVATPLYDRAWSDDFAQKVSWLATHGKQSAELTLNPPALGNIEISLRIDSDKSAATATFVSLDANVRETIETALPRLREMLAGVGITLSQAQVSAESFRQASGNEQNPGEGASPAPNELSILAADQEAPTDASIAGAGRGLVDMFV
jgi:flagellar hook-length control protein FliK